MKPDRRPGGAETLPVLNLVPNLLTIIGLCAGLTAIRFVLEGRMDVAAALIVFAAVIDGLDGLVARRLRATSSFGGELDSLSDFVCFGVAPGILIYHFALTGVPGLGWTFVLIFVISTCLRLARFNVARTGAGGVAAPAAGKTPPARPHFVGVPAPAGAMLALLPVFLTEAGVADLRDAGLAPAVYLALVGLAMVSRLPTLSPKALRIPRDRTRWALVGMALLIGLMITRFWLLMAGLCLIYALTLVWACAAAYRGRRTRRG